MLSIEAMEELGNISKNCNKYLIEQLESLNIIDGSQRLEAAAMLICGIAASMIISFGKTHEKGESYIQNLLFETIEGYLKADKDEYVQ